MMNGWEVGDFIAVGALMLGFVNTVWLFVRERTKLTVIIDKAVLLNIPDERTLLLVALQVMNKRQKRNKIISYALEDEQYKSAFADKRPLNIHLETQGDERSRILNLSRAHDLSTVIPLPVTPGDHHELCVCMMRDTACEGKEKHVLSLRDSHNNEYRIKFEARRDSDMTNTGRCASIISIKRFIVGNRGE